MATNTGQFGTGAHLYRWIEDEMRTRSPWLFRLRLTTSVYTNHIKFTSVIYLEFLRVQFYKTGITKT